MKYEQTRRSIIMLAMRYGIPRPWLFIAVDFLLLSD
jgi:hypothetical protein